MDEKRLQKLRDGLNRNKYVDDPAWTTSEAYDLLDWVGHLENEIEDRQKKLDTWINVFALLPLSVQDEITNLSAKIERGGLS